MKVGKLVLILWLFNMYGINAMNPWDASLSNVQPDVKRLILERLIVVDPKAGTNTIDDLKESIKNITTMATLDREFNSFINANMIWLVQNLVKRFGNRSVAVWEKVGENEFLKFVPVDESYFAKGFANMKGTQSANFKKYISAPSELREAIRLLDVERVKELLALGLDVNVTDKQNRSYLNQLFANIRCQDNEKDLAIFKLLMSAGANINNMELHGNTPIAIATRLRCPALMREVLKYRPDIQLSTGFGRSAIGEAFFSSDPEIMNVLKEYIITNDIKIHPAIMQTVLEFEETIKNRQQ